MHKYPHADSLAKYTCASSFSAVRLEVLELLMVGVARIGFPGRLASSADTHAESVSQEAMNGHLQYIKSLKKSEGD